jgi:glutathione S-transferase
MKLIGMLDSPYVRRVALSFQLLGLHFSHQALSVFRAYPEFKAINPVVKAPTLVCDDGEVLMDSEVILEYAEALARPRTLLPRELAELRHDLRLVGLALVACEKSVQTIYERKLRPPQKQHEPWLDRVSAQLHSAYDLIEAELGLRPIAATREGIGRGGVSAAVAWEFTQKSIPGVVDAQRYPRIAAFSAQAELLEEFRLAPYGSGTYPVRAAPSTS